NCACSTMVSAARAMSPKNPGSLVPGAGGNDSTFVGPALPRNCWLSSAIEASSPSNSETVPDLPSACAAASKALDRSSSCPRQREEFARMSTSKLAATARPFIAVISFDDMCDEPVTDDVLRGEADDFDTRHIFEDRNRVREAGLIGAH